MRWPPPAQFFTAALSIALFAPLLWTLAPESDYAVHIEEARNLAEHGSTRIPLPNFLFAGLTALAHAVLPGLGFATAGILVALGAQIALGALLCHLLARAWPGDASRAGAQIALPIGALSLMLVTPVHLATLTDHNLYHGYIGISVHHNPTVTLVKPLALLAFALAVRALERGESTWSARAGAAVVVALGVIAKPNYALALIPALAAVAAWRVLLGAGSRLPVDWPLLSWGFAAPAGALLVWQYTYTYSGAQASHPAAASSAIAFAPLLAMQSLSQTGPGGLAARLAASILFPLFVAALYFGAARRDLALRFAWLVFAVGAVYTYCLVETGPRFADGNFLWSGQIALFVLFVASAAFALRQAARDRSMRRWICASVYALHVVSGLIWYAVPFARLVDPAAPLLRDWF